MKAIASQQPWDKDPLAVRKPWNEAEYNFIDHGKGSKLCFSILWDDEQIVPRPPVIRGLNETKEAILAAGHQGDIHFVFFLKKKELINLQSSIGNH